MAKRGLLFIALGGVALAAAGSSTKKKKKKPTTKGSGSGGSGSGVNQCNPLEDPPAGMECFFDGVRHVLRKKSDTTDYGGQDAKAMPEISSDQVAFSRDFQHFKIGAKWRLNVLDNFLNIERKDGQLKLIRDNPYFNVMYYGGWRSEEDKQRAEEQAAENRAMIIARFFGQYNVQTVDGPVNMADIPGTDAGLEFADLVDSYIERYQRMDFE